MKNINSTEALELLQDNDINVIDVRTNQETLSGKIENSLNYDIMSPSFASNINALNKEATYIIVCRSGNRSQSACGFMEASGFQNIYNLQGGMMAWNGPK